MSNTFFVVFFGIIGIAVFLIFRAFFIKSNEDQPSSATTKRQQTHQEIRTAQYGRFPDFSQSRPKNSQKRNASRKYQDITSDESYDGYIPLRLELEFSYMNAEGEASRRRVSVRAVKAFNHGAWIRGYCHLRNEDRTFRIDRMSNCVNIATGEIFDDPVKSIRQELKARY